MRLKAASALLVLTVAACGEGKVTKEPTPEMVDAARAKAKVAIGIFQKDLKSALMSAIEAGGPASAIGVCKEAAPATAEAVSNDKDLTIGRTALRLRNPENAPDDWERAVLEDFQDHLAGGAAPGSLSAEKVEGETLRYMSPIPTGGLCLACHGSDLAPDVEEALSAQYPEDEATGFAAGELRGAFTVSVPLK